MEINATVIFEKNYNALFEGDKRFIVNQGGSRSSKTWSLCQLVIIWCLTNPKKIVSIVRKSMPALSATVMRDFFAVMNDMELYKAKNHNKTSNIYTFENGTFVEFFSTDDEQKLRGRKRDLCWANESNELLYDDFFQLNLRTSGKFIVDYNPSENDSWIYELPEDNKIIIKSTYKDNPFLEQPIIDAIEGLKETDDALYQIYALGEKAISKLNVYNNWTFLLSKPDYFVDYVYGMDYGFNHDTALVKVYYHDNEIFIETVICEPGLYASQMADLMEELGVDKNNEIMCDYARPEAIAELRDRGFNTQNANKDVKPGINNVKTFKVFASEYDNALKKEYHNYKWKKSGDRITDEVVKEYDDIMDAVRYAVMQIKRVHHNSSPMWSF